MILIFLAAGPSETETSEKSGDKKPPEQFYSNEYFDSDSGEDGEGCSTGNTEDMIYVYANKGGLLILKRCAIV